MSKIRQSARGEQCTVRIAGYCNRNHETTVLAHYRLADYCGMGIKPPDFMGAYACSSCHDAVDGRMKTDLSEEELRLAHAEGVMRTLVILEKKGLLK
jgi:putative bacteriophage protein